MAPFAFGTKTSKRGTSIASTIALATSSGSTGLTQRWPTPLVSSVLTIVGITQSTSMPLPRSSVRTASLIPTTACLVPE